MPDLAIDYAWQHPAPHNIRLAGYVGVFRYLSNDPSKDITPAEITALHAEGLAVWLVWETTAQRALAGHSAGVDDATEAYTRAAKLGYPKGMPLFFAVDFSATPAQVADYFAGVNSVASPYQAGDYGDAAIANGKLTKWHWQTAAWSSGSISPNAHVYQRVRPTKRIVGAPTGWDENVLLRSLPRWTGQKPAPAPAPAPVPAPATKPDGKGTVPSPAPKPAPAPAPAQPDLLQRFWTKVDDDELVDLQLLKAASSRRPRAKVALAAVLAAIKAVPRK